MIYSFFCAILYLFGVYLLIKLSCHPNWEQMYYLNTKKRAQDYKNWDSYLSTILIGGVNHPATRPLGSRYFGGLTFLINKIVEHHHILGVDISNSLVNIRRNLKTIFHLENKLSNSLFEGIAQNLCAVILVWLMIFAFKFTTNTSLKSLDYLLIFSWQFMGICLFIFTLFSLKTKYFSEYFELYKCLQILNVLHDYGANYGQLVSESNVFRLSCESEVLKNILSSLQGALHKHQKFGVDMLEEFHGVEQELIHFYELQFEKFNKVMVMAKFGFLVIFQVVCYFSILYKIGSTFIFQNLHL